ncbi:MAG TPA: peptidyl-prolyl cis-trans isomerase [Candidatus Eisenbacteria bacterium]|nr:peptidyl-prolyl cis-trans isomerase [Candidatus Eisenbacteria bacterium]
MIRARHVRLLFPSRLRAAAPAGVIAALLLSVAGCSGGPAPSGDAGAASRPASSGRPGVWSPSAPDTFGPVVAVVGGTKIRRHDVDSVIATAPKDLQPRLKTYDGYRQLVERLALEEAILGQAEAAGIEKDPEYQAELTRAKRAAKMRVFYNRRLASVPPPTDSLVRAYYEQNAAQYKIPARVRIRHIQLATQSDANTVRRSLVKGALWDDTAKKRSKDAATKDRGGLIGYVSQESDLVPGIGKSPAIVAAAFELKEGEISQPLKSEKGWHLIQADNLEAATSQPFEQVQAQIRSTLEAQGVEQFSTAYTESLKTAASVIFDDSIQVAIVPARTPQDFFKEAQAAVNAQDRIKLYRQLVARFPNDSVSVQARFMIGFTYAEDLGDLENAKKEFEEFLRIHPQSELVASARWMLENMDKPPPPMQEDAAPSDSTSAPSEPGGAKTPEQARQNP